MRLPLILAFALSAGPLVGQTRPIAPSRSVLFAAQPTPAPAQDTLTTDTGLQWWQGSIVGLGVGAGFGWFLGTIAAQTPCNCDDPGMEPFIGLVLGGLAGIVVGGSLAQVH